jgi:hypothetical protein
MSVDTGTRVDVAGEQTVAPVAYRYPGSPPFQDTDLDRRLFKGRTSEIDAVLHSNLSSNLFVLYALSGLGKTSLLNAGVMPELRARGYWPVSVRLNDPARDAVALVRDQIESAAEADPEVELQRDPSAGDRALAESTLWDLFAALEVWRGNQLQQLVVIFDQFEELFTLGWSATARERFIAQFGEVVRGHRLGGDHAIQPAQDAAALPPPAVKFVIVIREDSLGELEALATDVPQILRSRFRLGALDPVQAEVAIREPGLADDGRLHSPRFSYTPAACAEILDFLRTTTDRDTVVEGSAIDPSQLQIVCQYIERAIVPSKHRSSPDETVVIDAPDLGGRSGLQRVLGDFYRRTLDSIAVAAQPAVRRLCERGLVNAAGRRLSLEEGEIATTYGVRRDLLDHLVDARLLRADPRVGSVYYELAHDTLVAPILAFRDEARARRARRTRRIAFLAGGVLAVALLGVLAFVLVSRTSSDDVTARRLDAGETVTAGIEESGEMLLFSVEPSPAPQLAVVRPVDAASGSVDRAAPNVAVEYTTPAGVSRVVDELGPGGTERVMIPSAGENVDRGELRVTASGSSVGSFEVSLSDIAVTELTGDGPLDGAIDAPGDVVVYSVDADEGSRIAIDVTPVAASEPSVSDGRSVKDLDVRLELIDPTGEGSVVDENGSGQSEAAAMGGTAGRYYVVVRGYETTTGAFTIVARPDDFVLSLDEAKPGRIDASSPVAEFVLDVAEPGTYAVEVLPDSKFDPELAITDPTGGTRVVDRTGAGSAELEVLGSARGRYVIAVSGFDLSTGGFSIEGRRVGDALVLGQPVNGRIDGPADQAEFVFDFTEPGTYAIEVLPDAELDVMLQLSDPFGESRTLDDNPVGAAEFEVVRGTGGRYIVTVSGYDTSEGDFEILISAVDVVPLPGSGTSSGSGTTAYEPALAPDELVEISAEPDPGHLVDIRAIDVDGYLIDGVGSAEAGAAASLVLSGAEAFGAQVVVRSDGPYAVTFEPITPSPLASGSTVTASSTSAYEITAVADEILELRADPDDALGLVDVELFHPDGYALEHAASGEPGEAAAVILAGDAADSARVVVRSSGSYAVSLTTIPVQPLVAGDIVSGTGTTVYHVSGTPEELVELRIEPVSADGVIRVQTIDPDGFLVDGDESAQPGAAARVPLPTDVADEVQFVVRSDGSYTVTAVGVAVQARPTDGTTMASGTVAYELTLATDELVEFRTAPAADGYVDVRVIDTSGYVIDGARSVTAGEPATVLLDGSFTTPQLVVVMTTGEHTDTFAPSG